MGRFVYFARKGNQIKIGVSRDPRRRTLNLQARLLAVSPGSLELERKMHRRFEDLCIEGEWFRKDDKLMSFIAGLPSVKLPEPNCKIVSAEIPVELYKKVSGDAANNKRSVAKQFELIIETH